MSIPNAASAVVERQKLIDYLLNASHPENGGKAQFFKALGYTPQDWESLVRALRAIAVSGTAVETQHTEHGVKYVVEVNLVSSLPVRPQIIRRVRTVWVVEPNSSNPRLVTAYPAA